MVMDYKWKLTVGLDTARNTYEILSEDLALWAFGDAQEMLEEWGFIPQPHLAQGPFHRVLVHPEKGVYATVALEKVPLFPQGEAA